MSRRLVVGLNSAGAIASTPPPDPDPDPGPPDDTTPYAMPTAAPYNAPTYAITPTPDGTGSVVHPDVIDFAQIGAGDPWRGFRYWMGVTPYYLANADKEDPCVLASHDGFTWQVPPGGTNPIDQNTVGSNSDTDIVYDPDADRLILTWREYKAVAPYDEWIYGSASTDGVTWSAPVLLWHVDAGGIPEAVSAQQSVSQALVRVGPGDWRAWSCARINAPNSPALPGVYPGLRTATDPLGTWSGPTPLVFSGATGWTLWHFDVIRHDGEFRMLMDCMWQHRPAVSTDGIHWSVGAAYMSNDPASWDTTTLYRATMQPHEDGTHYRCWYSSDSTTPSSWRVGYTQIPQSLWSALTPP